MFSGFGHADSYLQTAAEVRQEFWTESFVCLVLLQSIIDKSDGSSVEVYLDAILMRGEPFKSPLSTWLTDCMGSNEPYCKLKDSLLSFLGFVHDVSTGPSLNDLQNPSGLDIILKAFKEWKNAHELAPSSFKQEYIDGIDNHTTRGCLMWIKGLYALESSCFVLATSCFRDALLYSSRLHPLLFNAYQAYSRKCVDSAALESLRLFARVGIRY